MAKERVKADEVELCRPTATVQTWCIRCLGPHQRVIDDPSDRLCRTCRHKSQWDKPFVEECLYAE